jgi:hypothetical protein
MSGSCLPNIEEACSLMKVDAAAPLHKHAHPQPHTLCTLHFLPLVLYPHRQDCTVGPGQHIDVPLPAVCHEVWVSRATSRGTLAKASVTQPPALLYAVLPAIHEGRAFGATHNSTGCKTISVSNPQLDPSYRPCPHPHSPSIYLFMASIASLLGLWALFLVPETNRVPIERLQAAFAHHWLWRRFYASSDEESPKEDTPSARDQSAGRRR